MCSYTHDNDNTGEMGGNSYGDLSLLWLSFFQWEEVMNIYLLLGKLGVLQTALFFFTIKFFNTCVCIPEDCLRKKISLKNFNSKTS